MYANNLNFTLYGLCSKKKLRKRIKTESQDTLLAIYRRHVKLHSPGIQLKALQV